jgi:hypothetical protein
MELNMLNGQAENSVKTVKRALKKHLIDAKKSMPRVTPEARLDRFLLMYRTTPHATTGRSPADIFLKCRPKTRFDLRKTFESAQDTQKVAHDRHSNNSVR